MNGARKLLFTLSDLNILNAWQVQARFGPLSWGKIYYSWRRWPCHSHSVTLYPSFPVPKILTAETTSNIEIIYNFFCQACVIPLSSDAKIVEIIHYKLSWKKVCATSACQLTNSVQCYNQILLTPLELALLAEQTPVVFENVWERQSWFWSCKNDMTQCNIKLTFRFPKTPTVKVVLEWQNKVPYTQCYANLWHTMWFHVKKINHIYM